MTARPVHRMPRELRRRYAAGLVGRLVVVRWNSLREEERAAVTVGRLLAVAVPTVSVADLLAVAVPTVSVADLLVVETTSGYWPLAISLASVFTVEEAPAGATPGTTYAAEPEVEPWASSAAARG